MRRRPHGSVTRCAGGEAGGSAVTSGPARGGRLTGHWEAATPAPVCSRWRSEQPASPVSLPEEVFCVRESVVS